MSDVCTNAYKFVWGRLEMDLKCQLGIHRGGHCRMVVPGTQIVIMFPKEIKSEG